MRFPIQSGCSLLITGALLVTAGCATVASKSTLPTPIEEAAVSTDKFETVVLFATANIQGALLPSDASRSEPLQGGAALLESYYRIAQHDFGTRTVWLDAGNLRGHSLESDFDQGRSFERFVDSSGIAVTLDGHPPARETEPPAAGAGPVSAPGPKELPKDQASHVVIDAGRVRLGVISAQSGEDVKHQASKARDDGAQLVVWLTNLAIQCNPKATRDASLFRKPGDSNGFCEGKLNDVLSKLPTGTIDAVVASGSDRQAQNYIYPHYSADLYSGIPVVEGSPFGRSVHLVYLTYDLVNHQTIASKTRIEGPVMVCSRIFKNQGDCDDTRDAPENGRGALVRSRFHGKTIEADQAVQALAEPVQNWISEKEKEIVAESDEPLASNPMGESTLADLIADAIRAETQSDFAIVHPGLVKHAVGHSAFHPGPISQADLSRAFPADTAVYVVRVSGEELKTLVRISENGSRGFASVSGMKLSLIRPDREAPATSLTGERRPSLWEQNRLLTLTDLEDEPVSARQFYRLAVPAFLVEGGDDWSWATEHFGLARRIDSHAQTPSARHLVALYLKRLGKIGSVPARIQFEEPHTKRARHGKHRRARRKPRTRTEVN